MSRANNPYYTAPAGEYGAVGQGLSNLGAAFMQTPSPGDVAKAEALAWQARGAKQDQQFARDDRTERMTLADVIAGSDPTTFDAPAVLAQGIRSGQAQNDLGQLMLNYMANTAGATDEQRAGALLGTGRAIGTDQAVSLDHQARLLDRAAAEAQDGSPMSRDQAIASIFLEQGADAAEQARNAMYPPTAVPKDNMWLDADRRAGVEQTLQGEIDRIAGELGNEDLALPPELRNRLTLRSMELIQKGAAPRQALGIAMEELKVRRAGQNWFGDGSDRIEYSAPPAGSTDTPPPTGQTALPPISERVPGQVYETPRGPMIWTVQPDGQAGWLPAGA